MKQHFLKANGILFCSTLVLLCLSLTKLTAQTISVFSTLSENSPLLSQPKKDFIQKIKTLSYTEAISVLQINDLKSSQSNGTLQFLLPGLETSPISASAIQVDYLNNDNYIWYGKILSEPGYIQLISKPEGIGGFIQIDQRFYVLWPLGDKHCVVAKQDLTKFNTDNDCGVKNNAHAQIKEYCDDENLDCPAVVDVLVLMTPEAAAWLPNVGNPFLQGLYCEIGVQSVNAAFQNSGIQNKRIRRHWAVINDFQFTADPNNITTDAENMAFNAQITALRDQYKADLVVMLTNRGYFNENGNQIFGSATQGVLENPDDASLSYAIVEIPFMVGARWTFAHETGHMFGARHNNDPANDCAHGFIFTDENDVERRTLLGVGVAGNRELHYSNPDIGFNGGATGDEDHNNAIKINHTACIIDDFKPSPEASVLIYGNSLFCSFGQSPTPKTYMAGVIPAVPDLPGQPPFTYEWRRNISGIFDANNPGVLLGTGSSVTINFPPNCPNFFLRVRVTSSDGHTFFATKNIHTALCSPPCLPGQLVESQGDFINSDFSASEIYFSDDQNRIRSNEYIGVFPNPAQGEFSLFALLTNDQPVKINVYDINGTIVKSIEQVECKEGENSIHINVEDLPSGYYICHIQVGNKLFKRKVVLTH